MISQRPALGPEACQRAAGDPSPPRGGSEKGATIYLSIDRCIYLSVDLSEKGVYNLSICPLYPKHRTSWRNTVEMILFDISSSMKPYPPVSHAYISELRPNNVDEASDRIPPTSQTTILGSCFGGVGPPTPKAPGALGPLCSAPQRCTAVPEMSIESLDKF